MGNRGCLHHNRQIWLGWRNHALLLTAIALSSCTNSNFKSKLSSIGSIEATPPSDTGPVVPITQVVKSSKDPTSTFDILGDGTGAIGQVCTEDTGEKAQTPAGSGEGDSDKTTRGQTTCNCAFTYTKGTGEVETFEVPTIYHENNLLRCRFTGLPTAVQSVKVKIHVRTLGAFSNEIEFKFDGTGAATDLSNPLNFVRVERFECKDILTFPYMFDYRAAGEINVYDPIQSESPHISYPLNFYTSNMGLSLALYAGGIEGLAPSTDFNCSPNPRDEPKIPIFSQAPDSNGSKLIFPTQAGSLDRSTYYLSRKRLGIFNVPVNAYLAPGIPSHSPAKDGTQSGAPPLGFGASPVPAGTGKEKCPDSSIAIPEGFKWVKVWLFRMGLPFRKKLVSPAIIALNDIACNPGNFAPSSFPPPHNAVFPDCSGSPNLSDSSFASRFALGTGMCFNVTAGGTGLPDSPTISPAFAPFGFAPGTDIWANVGADPDFKCGGRQPIDPTHACSGPPGSVPFDNQIAAFDVDDTNNNRFDFIFVVTPDTVNSADMISISSPIRQTHTPFRFLTRDDCNSPDPDLPLQTGDCDPTFALRNYGLKLNDVTTPGDQTGTPSFPVCALQPTL